MSGHMRERCPLCGAPVSESRYGELQTQIREEERRNLETAMTAARDELERAHRDELASQAAALRAEAALLQSERVAELSTDLQAKEAERVRLEAVVADLESKRQALAQEREREIRAAIAEAERRRLDDLAQQRVALEKDRDEQLRRLNEERHTDQDRWQARLSDLQRQVEKKTADELGHWPELNLYQSLQEEFQDDRVTRIGKGEEGADILVEVMRRGEACGRILIDSKNRKAWQNRYVEKLRHDQDAAKAEHAVLATSVFPSGAKDLCIREGGVIVVRPHGVLAIVRILRSSLISNQVHQLGAQEREAKAARLYAYMSSADFKRHLAAALTACEQLEDLDVEEKRSHDKTWQKRGSLQREIARSLGDVDTTVSGIIEASDVAKHRIA